MGDPLKVLGRSRGYSRAELLKNLPRHKNFKPIHLKEVKDMEEVVLQNLGNQKARKIIHMIKEVFKEVYRAKQFTRTEINNRGVLYGVVLLKHHVMDLVLEYFHERWPKCLICLYNEHTQMTEVINEKGIIRKYKNPLDFVVTKISQNRPIIPYFDDIKFSGEELFQTLYKTQNITERENIRYFKQMIPDKCFDLPGLRYSVEKEYILRNKKIDEYFD